MSRLINPVCIFLIVLGSTFSEGQRHRVIPHPPAPAETQRTTSGEPPQKKHFDALQIQREARELSDLAKSIPLDMERVNQGLMPKDMVEKLKRIEKLSKHLRVEVTY
ncbi:MAG: hypothetical protein DMG71_02055 [Acidobacteria bacterium]|nr:MAG: hypothetical protein DMG71_02055 [Acidobacteriota bacterium]